MGGRWRKLSRGVATGSRRVTKSTAGSEAGKQQASLKQSSKGGGAGKASVHVEGWR